MSKSLFTQSEIDTLKKGLAQASRRGEQLQEMIDIERGNTLKQIEKTSEVERKAKEKVERIVTSLKDVDHLIGMNEDSDSIAAVRIVRDIIKREGGDE